MAVTNIQEKEHLGGSFNEQQYSIKVRYQCDTSDGDGAMTIKRHPFFRLGKSYTFGSESNPSCRLAEVNPTLPHGNAKRTHWHIDCVYSTRQPESSDNDGGDDGGTDRPTNSDVIEDSLEVRYFRDQVELTQAVFMGTFTRDETGLSKEPVYSKLGDVIDKYTGKPLNSALQPYEPAPYGARSLAVYRYNTLRNAGFWLNRLGELINKINDAPYKLTAPGGSWSKTFPARTLQVADVSMAPITPTNAGYVMFTIEIVHDPDGHYRWFTDEGTVVKNDLVKVTTEGTDTGIPYDYALSGAMEVIRDESGAAIPTPSLLDGKGGALDPRGITYLHRYLESADIEADFKRLPDAV